MAKLHFYLRLCQVRLQRQHQPENSGFTLLELLVALLIGSIITLSLLSLVIELTDANRKDSARTETQRDMQLATDFITQELREAAFVYDSQCLISGNGKNGSKPTTEEYPVFCPGLSRHLPKALTENSDRVPVLAFWRPTALPKVVWDKCSKEAEKSSPKFENLVTGEKRPHACLVGATRSLCTTLTKAIQRASGKDMLALHDMN